MTLISKTIIEELETQAYYAMGECRWEGGMDVMYKAIEAIKERDAMIKELNEMLEEIGWSHERGLTG